jgi:hypothetical protein
VHGVPTSIIMPSWTIAVADDVDAVREKVTGAWSSGQMLGFRTDDPVPRRVFLNPNAIASIQESQPGVLSRLWELL